MAELIKQVQKVCFLGVWKIGQAGLNRRFLLTCLRP